MNFHLMVTQYVLVCQVTHSLYNVSTETGLSFPSTLKFNLKAKLNNACTTIHSHTVTQFQSQLSIKRSHP